MLEGQWYRLITSSFLHGGVFHLLLNSLALLASGVFLEKFIGHVWFFTIYFFSILGGSICSILINGENVVSVGASGAIMGIIAASLVMSCRLSSDENKSEIQTELMRWLIPALIPLASRGNIDFAGHMGGAIMGGLIAFFVFKTWNEKLNLPRFIKFATMISIVSVFLIFSAINQAEKNRTLLFSMINAEFLKELASSQKISKENIKKLQNEYPKDPRTWYFSATQESDLDSVEQYLRRALSQKEVLNSIYFKDGELEKALRLALVLILVDEGKGDEAEKTIIPHCNHILNNNENNQYPTQLFALCKKVEGN